VQQHIAQGSPADSRYHRQNRDSKEIESSVDSGERATQSEYPDAQ